VEISGLVVIAAEHPGVAAPARRPRSPRGGSAERLTSATGADDDALEPTLNGLKGAFLSFPLSNPAEEDRTGGFGQGGWFGSRG
jgi:hypothetical protein